MAMGPKNVFNNKADFKVPLPVYREGPAPSAKGLGCWHEPAQGEAQQ
jgi:hypothetical protein